MFFLCCHRVFSGHSSVPPQSKTMLRLTKLPNCPWVLLPHPGLLPALACRFWNMLWTPATLHTTSVYRKWMDCAQGELLKITKDQYYIIGFGLNCTRLDAKIVGNHYSVSFSLKFNPEPCKLEMFYDNSSMCCFDKGGEHFGRGTQTHNFTTWLHDWGWYGPAHNRHTMGGVE